MGKYATQEMVATDSRPVLCEKNALVYISTDNLSEFSRARSRFKDKDNIWCWCVCILILLSSLIIFGCSITYGIIFPDILKEFSAGKAVTAIPGALAVANSGILGPIGGLLCDRWGCRVVMLAGCVTCAVGLLASAFAPHIAVLYATFGLVNGFGLNLMYMSSQLIIPLYFDQRRMLATAIVTTGPGAGLFVVSPIVQAISQVLDWRKLMMCMAAIAFAPFFPALFYRRNENRKWKAEEKEDSAGCLCRSVDCSVLKTPTFALSTVMVAITCLGHTMPLTHLAKHCEELGLTSDRSSWLYFTIGLCSTASRLLSGKLSETGWFTLPRLYQIGALVLASGNLLLPLVTEYPYLILYGVTYGLGEGLMLTPMYCLILESLPMEKRGRAYGVFQLIISVPCLCGPALSGLIADVSNYNTSFYTAGSLELVGAIMPFLLWFMPHSSTKEELELTQASVTTETIIIERESVL